MLEPADHSHLHIEFFASSRQNKRKSEEEGRPIFDDIEMVKIRLVGDTSSVHVAPANDQSSAYDPETGHRLTYAELYPRHYEAFKQGQELIGSGTPLTQVTFLSAAKADELKALNVVTVEQLAELDGANLQRLGMGARALKDQATAYLQRASNAVDVGKLASENEALRDRLAALESAMQASSGPQMEQDAGPPANADPSPFDDWDKETLKLWFEEQGGTWDGRWSISRAREEADKLNNKLSEAA